MESVPVCAGVLLEVLALCSVAALTPVGVQFAWVKHLCVISGTQLCTKHTMKPNQSVDLFTLFPDSTGIITELI